MIIGCWNIIKMGKLVKRAPPWSRVWKWPWQPSHANPTTCRGPAQDQPCDKTMHILILSLNFIRYLVYYCIVRLGNQKSVRGADLETEQCRVSRGRILTPFLLVNKTFLFLSIYMKLKLVVVLNQFRLWIFTPTNSFHSNFTFPKGFQRKLYLRRSTTRQSILRLLAISESMSWPM